jgi:hypothetical protein
MYKQGSQCIEAAAWQAGKYTMAAINLAGAALKLDFSSPANGRQPWRLSRRVGTSPASRMFTFISFDFVMSPAVLP